MIDVSHILTIVHLTPTDAVIDWLMLIYAVAVIVQVGPWAVLPVIGIWYRIQRER